MTDTPQGFARWWSRLPTNAPLLRSSVSLSGATGLSAFGGFIYWLAIARITSAHVLGAAAALYSSVQFVNYVTGLGLPVAVARYGASPKDEPSVLFNWAVVLTVCSSIAGSAIFLALVPNQLHELAALGAAGAVVVFSVAVAGISIYTILDVRLLSQQRRGWVVGKAAFVAVSRLPFLLLPAVTHSVVGVFLVAAGAPAVSGLLAWVFADLRSVRWAFPLSPLPSHVAAAGRYALVNGVAQLAVQGPFYAVPLVVLIVVTAGENAFFYVAWTITTVLFLVVQGVGQALLVEAHRSGRLASQTRSALEFALGLGVLLFATCIVAAVLVPTFYGAGYTRSSSLIVIMGAAVFPWCLFSVVVSATRVRHGQWQNIALSTIFAVSILVPSLVWVLRYGITGAAWAWLVGNLISAAVAGMVLVRLRRSPVLDAPAAHEMDLLDNPEFL